MKWCMPSDSKICSSAGCIITKLSKSSGTVFTKNMFIELPRYSKIYRGSFCLQS